MDFLDRLKIERDELNEKAEKLHTFILGTNFKGIDPVQKMLLRTQLSVMYTYLIVLDQRILHLKTTTPQNGERIG